MEIFSYPANQLILTAGANGMIRLTKIRPEAKQILSVIVSIDCSFQPCNIAMIDHTICVSDISFKIHMYRYNLHRKGNLEQSQIEAVQNIECHSTSDDHTGSIKSIISIPKLNIFVSASLDMTLKVWDSQNTLMREIVFSSPLETLCLCNPKGDILLGIKDRVDIIKYHQCNLPI